MNIYLYVICGMVASFLLCIGTILFYLKYKKNILKKQYQIKEAEVLHQKELLQAIITSQEEERKRIGMDLHDEVGSKLSSLRFAIESFYSREIEKLSGSQFSIQSKTMIDSIINNVRNISHNLSPVLHGPNGFYNAILDYCDEVTKLGSLNISIQIEDKESGNQLSNIVALTFYRIVIELINNTIKHAEASSATLTFIFSNGIYTIEYEDNGNGMKAGTRRGMGMKNIESRLGIIGAEYTVMPKKANGFNISIYLKVK